MEPRAGHWGKVAPPSLFRFLFSLRLFGTAPIIGVRLFGLSNLPWPTNPQIRVGSLGKTAQKLSVP